MRDRSGVLEVSTGGITATLMKVLVKNPFSCSIHILFLERLLKKAEDKSNTSGVRVLYISLTVSH